MDCGYPSAECHDADGDTRYEKKSKYRKKEAAMTNGVLASRGNLFSNVTLSPEPAGKKRTAPSGTTRTVRREKTAPQDGGRFGKTLTAGLLDRKMTSLTIASLVQAAASSGKRLILEIRDENPVQIVRTTTRGM
jgi:hypothetical protein